MAASTIPVASSSSYPFLTDAATVEYVQNSDVMFIMRGLPGSGKSTLAQKIKARYRGAVVCSAEDYFLTDGVYCFDDSKLGEAHEFCQSQVQEACHARKGTVIVDNSNIHRWEMDFYTGLAKKCDYLVIVVTPDTPWRFDLSILIQKTKRKTSLEKLARKVAAFEEVLPIYSGWFLNRKAKDDLMALVEGYYSQCRRKVPGFRTEDCNDTDGIQESAEPFLERYYPKSNLHCTAFFCGRYATDEARAYAKRPAVIEAMGKMSDLTIIGFVITPRTVGARLELTQAQLELWGQDDFEETQGDSGGQAASGTGSTNTESSEQDSSVDSLSEALRHKASLQEGSAQRVAQKTCTSRFRPLSGFGCRAHITLGCAPDVSAVQTGFDLIDIVSCEAQASDRLDYVPIDGAAVRDYDEGCYVVYLDKAITVQSLFSGFY